MTVLFQIPRNASLLLTLNGITALKNLRIWNNAVKTKIPFIYVYWIIEVCAVPSNSVYHTSTSQNSFLCLRKFKSINFHWNAARLLFCILNAFTTLLKRLWKSILFSVYLESTQRQENNRVELRENVCCRILRETVKPFKFRCCNKLALCEAPIYAVITQTVSIVKRCFHF
jgi:hypothetical protein